ncbi:MAG: hypothetical protein ACOVK9_01130 [Bacteroidia bacterium]
MFRILFLLLLFSIQVQAQDSVALNPIDSNALLLEKQNKPAKNLLDSLANPALLRIYFFPNESITNP